LWSQWRNLVAGPRSSRRTSPTVECSIRYTHRSEISGQPLGVHAQLLSGCCLPMIGAQHGSDVEQVVDRTAVTVDERPMRARANSQLEWVGHNQPLRDQRADQRLA